MNGKLLPEIKDFLEIETEPNDSINLEPYRTRESCADIIDLITSLGGKFDLIDVEINEAEWLMFFPFEFGDNVYVLRYNIFYNNDMKIYHEEDTREYFMKAKD